MNWKLFFALYFAIFSCVINTQAQEKQTIFDLMYHTEVLDLNLYTDFKAIDSLKNTNTYLPAKLVFETADKQESDWGIKIRPRGKFRRKVCLRPPLKLNFVKGQLSEAGLKKDDDLKLVTQCMDGFEGKEYVLREYLTYKLYNIISEESFRAQLVRINYNCTSTNTKERSWGIVIEDEKSVARKLKSELCDPCFSRKKEEFNAASLTKATLFQYMIGNTDYSITLNRNIKIFEAEDGSGYKVAPYDFDFSGLVDARYAIPDGNYNLKSNKERLFIGLSNDEELKEAILHYKAKKKEIIDTIDDFKVLGKGIRNEMKKFVLEFYDSLDEGVTRFEPNKKTEGGNE